MQEPLPPTKATSPHSQPPRSGLATASLVLGILPLPCWCLSVLFLRIAFPHFPAWLPAWVFYLSVCLLGVLAGLLATVLGQIARHRVRKAPERHGGAGFAKTGIVMGYVSIFATTLLLAISFPSLRPAIPIAQQKACINNLRQIDAAKEQWALENHKKPGDAVVDDQVNAYLNGGQRPLCPEGGTYTYNPVGVKPTCSAPPALGHTL